MRRFRSALVLVCYALLVAPAVAAPAAPRPLDQLKWLAGGVWTADASKLGGGLARIETRYDSAADGNLLRFTTAFIDTKDNVVNRYAGNFYFDAGSNQLRLWYVSSKNALFQGDVTPAGRNFSFAFTDKSDGTEYLVSVEPDANYKSYLWTLHAGRGDAAKTLFSLTYALST